MPYIIVGLGSALIMVLGLRGCDKYFESQGVPSSPVNQNQELKTIKTSYMIVIAIAIAIFSIVIYKKMKG